MSNNVLRTRVDTLTKLFKHKSEVGNAMTADDSHALLY